jgi:DNA topoisomerase-1
MAQAVFDATAVDIKAEKYLFRTNGSLVKFAGFLKVYQMKFEETELPDLTAGDILELIKITPEQHFTQPPGRFTEATLIKALELEGIGRPSTYAPIISTIQDRNYIEKNENKYFKPTEIGLAVDDLLVAHFPKIVDIKFTANMEEEFDKIAQGKRNWTEALKEFYAPFAENLAEKYKEVAKKEYTEETAEEKPCPKCGAKLLIRLGKFGKFYACSRFPECKYTESLKKAGLAVHCPKCTEGELTEKRTKKGKIFYGCNKFPECNFALWDKPTGDLCPQCRNLLITSKKGKIKCSNKECEYVRETPVISKK